VVIGSIPVGLRYLEVVKADLDAHYHGCARS
jgi:hypothetical protein